MLTSGMHAGGSVNVSAKPTVSIVPHSGYALQSVTADSPPNRGAWRCGLKIHRDDSKIATGIDSSNWMDDAGVVLSMLPIAPSIHRWLLAGLLWFVAVAGLTTGCAKPKDSARFQVAELDTSDRIRECFEKAFPLEPTYFAVRERIDGSVGIFMQTKTRAGPAGNMMFFEIYTEDRTGSPIEFQYPSDTSSPARSNVAMYEACPRLDASLAVEGTIEFDSFGTESGDRIVGELSGGTIIDAKRDEPIGQITGTWDFGVELGYPHRLFANDRDEFPKDL
jgi:hypothetical protein